MKRLELDIEKCYDCPYLDRAWDDGANYEHWCLKAERDVQFKDADTLPGWCPLEEVVDSE